jgi:hypothetical protein
LHECAEPGVDVVDIRVDVFADNLAAMSIPLTSNTLTINMDNM